MVDTSNVFSGFSVDDLSAAKEFYGGVLGLDVLTNEGGFLEIRLPAGGYVLVYDKADHTPASFTILNLAVADIDVAVDELTARGVEMQRYDGMPQDEKGIMRGNGPDIAWFTDPAGNVISVLVMG